MNASLIGAINCLCSSNRFTGPYTMGMFSLNWTKTKALFVFVDLGICCGYVQEVFNALPLLKVYFLLHYFMLLHAKLLRHTF